MEYIKLDPSEQMAGKKDLLHSQMEILSIMQRYQKYKQYRKEELALKSLFKKKVAELTEEMKMVDKLIPKGYAPKPEPETSKIQMAEKSRFDLEAEIEAIKSKIARLQ
jgi:hypothetical protein